MVEPIARIGGINWAWAFFEKKPEAEQFMVEQKAEYFARGDEYRANIQGQVEKTYTDRLSGRTIQQGWWIVHYHL